jgi:predicted DNA-binding transcriptional regulator AlpA
LNPIGFNTQEHHSMGTSQESKRGDFPDYEERSRRLGALIAAPALPLADVALFLDLPLSTVDKLRATGDGPRCFKLGRRLYVRQADLRAWLDRMATEAAA